MNLKEKLASYFKKIGMEDGKVASLFNEDGTEFAENATQTILDHDASRIQALKSEGTKLFDQGHSKGLAEGAQKIEKAVREKYGVNSEKLGIELIDEIVASRSKSTSPELDDEKVKSHPLFIKMEGDLKKQLESKDNEWMEKIKEKDNEFAKIELFKEVVSKGKSIALGLNPILPTDTAKQERQMGLLVSALKGLEYSKTEDGDYVLSKDGKRLEDKHGNRITFEQYVKAETESIWELGQGQKRDNTGNSNDGKGNGNSQGQWTGKVPTNRDEYNVAISNAKDANERMAIADAYEAAQNQ